MTFQKLYKFYKNILHKIQLYFACSFILMKEFVYLNTSQFKNNTPVNAKHISKKISIWILCMYKSPHLLQRYTWNKITKDLHNEPASLFYVRIKNFVKYVDGVKTFLNYLLIRIFECDVDVLRNIFKVKEFI